jgi:hypothetical protein
MCSAWDAQLSQKRNPERDEPERGVDALLDVGEGRSGVRKVTYVVSFVASTGHR